MVGQLEETEHTLDTSPPLIGGDRGVTKQSAWNDKTNHVIGWIYAEPPTDWTKEDVLSYP